MSYSAMEPSEMKSFLDAETNSGELLPEETIEQIIHETNPLLDSKVSLKLRWSMSNFAVSQIQSDSPLVLEWITRLWNTEDCVKQRMHIFSADLLVNRFLNLHHNRKHGAEKMLKKIGELIHMIFDLLGAEVGDSFCTHFSEKLIEDCNADGTSVNRLISMLFHLLGDPRYPALLAITVSIFTWTQASLKLTPKLAAKGVQVLGAFSSDPRAVATTSSSSSSSFIGRTMMTKEREKVADRHARKGGKNENGICFNGGEQGWDLWNGSPGAENATTGPARRFLELKFKCPMEFKNACSSCISGEEHDACMDLGAPQDENFYPRNEQNDCRERKVKRTKVSDPYVDYDREMQRLLHALAFASAQRLVTVFHHSKNLNPRCHHALHEQALRMWPVAHFAVPAQEGLKDANYRLRVLTLQKMSQWYELRSSGMVGAASSDTDTGTAVGGVSEVAHNNNNTRPHLTAKLIHSIAACSTHAHPHVRKQVALFFTTHLSSMSPNLTWEHWVQFTLMFNSTSFPSSTSSTSSGEKWEQAEGHPVLMDALARLPGSELVHFLNAHPEPRAVVTRIVRAWASQAPFGGGGGGGGVGGSKGTKHSHSTDDDGSIPYNTLSMVTQKLAHHFFASRTHEAATAFDRLMDAVMENYGDGVVNSDSDDSDKLKINQHWLPQAGEGFMTQLFSLTFTKELNAPTRHTILTVLRKLFHIGVKLPDSFMCSGLIHDLCNETQTSGDLKMVRCIIQLLHALNDNRVTDAGTAEAYAVDLCVKTQDYLKKLKNANANSNSCDENTRENKNYLKAGDAVLTRLYAMTCFVEACSADLKLSVHTFNMLSMLYRENEDPDVRRSIIEAQTPLYRYLSAQAGLTEEIFLKFVLNELTWAFENDLSVGLESALLLVEDAVKRGDGAKMEILSRLAALANARFSTEPRAVVSFLGVFLERGIIFPSDFMLDGKLIAMIMGGDTTHADIALQYLKHMEPRHVAHGFLVGVEEKTRDALRAAMGPSFFNTKAGNEGDRVGNIIELLNHFDIKGRSIIGHAMLRCLELGPAEYNFFRILAMAMPDVAAWNGKLLEDWCNGLTSIQPQTTEARILQATSFWMCQSRTKRGLLQNAIQAATNVDTPEAIWHWWSDMRGQVVDEFGETSTATLPLGKRRRLSRLNCNSSSRGVPSLRSRSEPCVSHSKERYIDRNVDIDMW